MWGPIIRGALWIAGGLTAGKVIEDAGNTAEQAGEAAERSTDLVKWAVLGGCAYMAFKQVNK
ncbi:hypothetical protein [Planktotalea arctica]|uniref:hypothetical protein n=1 Tax=Planktotalea arctica TaxID=1481893 RepID=UPI00321C2A60